MFAQHEAPAIKFFRLMLFIPGMATVVKTAKGVSLKEFTKKKVL